MANAHQVPFLVAAPATKLTVLLSKLVKQSVPTIQKAYKYANKLRQPPLANLTQLMLVAQEHHV
jgi:hypothetical protein